MRYHRKNRTSSLYGGVVCFILAFVILFWNEGNYIKNARVAEYTEKHVVSVVSKDVANDNKLIHYTANVSSDEIIGDQFISVRAVALKRVVEMYQWSCKRRDSDNQLECHKKWSSSKLHSEGGYNNPEFPYTGTKVYAKNVLFGDFMLTKNMVHKLKPSLLYEDLPRYSNNYVRDGQYLYSYGAVASSPNVGDTRISYYYMPSNTRLSIIAGQNGNYLEPYNIKSGSIAMVKEGSYSVSEVIESFKKSNVELTNILRFVGFILMLVGLSNLGRTFLHVFSLLGLGRLANGFSFIISLPIALALSLLTIAVAWIYYNLLLGLILIGTAVALIIFAYKRASAN